MKKKIWKTICICLAGMLFFTNMCLDVLAASVSDGDAANIVVYGEMEDTSDITEISYTISFDGNGSTSGSMLSMEACQYDTSYVLTENSFERTGYIFAGWNTAQDGSGTSYENEAEVMNLSATDGETITLYAQWQTETYTITYNLNGGTNNSGNPGTYTITSSDIILKNPTKTGHAFNGWYSDSACTNQITTIAEGSTGNRTFYAKWTANTYSVKFVGNGSTGGSMNNMTDRVYGKSFKLRKNAFKKTGYTFVGWNTKKDGSGTAYADNASVMNLTAQNGKTITLYAQWEKTAYKITYNLKGGKNNSKNPGTYYITSSTITLKDPTRKGYTFAGWYSDSKCTKEVTKIAKGSTGNKTLYAKWTANKYTIKFNGNGSTGGSVAAMKSCKYNKKYTLRANSFKKTGYIFAGWNTKKDGSGTAYADKSAVQGLSAKQNGTATLYAQWEPIKYSVRFMGNGATDGSMSKLSSCAYDSVYKLPANKFTRTGYKFAGWNTKANGTGISYKNKEEIENLTSQNGKTIKLYAQWKENFDKITLDVASPTQKEIKAFVAGHPVSTVDTFKTMPSTSSPYSAGVLSNRTLKNSLNAINTIRYIAGLNANVKLDKEYSEKASAATFVNYLNNSMSHYPGRPSVLSASTYDELYQDGYDGASHSNLAWGFRSMYSAIVDGWLGDSDTSNIDRVGHRRWLLYPKLGKVGFGKTGSQYAMYTLDSSGNGNQTKVAWPAQNTPVEYFNAYDAWSLSMGEYQNMEDIVVILERTSDKKTWTFSSDSADGYFNVENSYYGDPGCIIFRPDDIGTISAGDKFKVTVKDYGKFQVLTYNVKFFSLQ